MSADHSDIQDLLQNADQLFDENQYQEVIDVLKKHPNYDSDANILWRLARALYKLSGTNKAKKEECIKEGFEAITKALEIDETNYACHKWMAVLLDTKCELVGIKERVSQLENVKKHMEKAVELNPNDPTNWHLLGNFAFGLADMPWYQRKVVSAIFATPPTGTYEEALEYFLKAEQTKANFYSMNLLFIGRCYYNLKNKEKAKEYLTRAAEVTVSIWILAYASMRNGIPDATMNAHKRICQRPSCVSIRCRKYPFVEYKKKNEKKERRKKPELCIGLLRCART
uniref:Regulator of microtubule dynamics protein 1 n=1 Tax=Mayetiola destructor TaxID=39758 RepID=D1MLM4_MAYDE|nr:hypothetical protein [Mayetiola destructor]